MEPLLVVGPASEPVTRDEAKLHARIEQLVDDPMVDRMIAAARGRAEHLTRKLIDQQWDLYFDTFPESDLLSMQLHWDVVRVSAIVDIVYLNTSNVLTTWDPLNYVLDPYNLPGYVVLAQNASWPADVADASNAVRVRVKSGFGPTAASVPEEIKAYILRHVAWQYDFRSAGYVGSSPYPDDSTERLLDYWVTPRI